MNWLTPSASSSILTGGGLWAIFWSFLFKSDTLISNIGLNWKVRDNLLKKMNRNKIVTLSMTEAFNFFVHGITSPLSVAFALGGTIVNIFMLSVFVPLFLRAKKIL